MAAAKFASVCFSVFLAITAISFTAADATGGAEGVPVPAALPFLPGGGGEATTTAADCLEAVMQAESCGVDVLRWFASPDLAIARVGAACCGVLARVGGRCLDDLFHGSELGALYAPIVSHACAIPLGVVTPGARQ